MKTPELGAELKHCLATLEEAMTDIDDALSAQPSARLLAVRVDVERAHTAAARAWERYVGSPAEKLLRAERLTREEFYLLVAGALLEGAAKQFTGAPVDDYELFDLLCYDDGRERCYINPALTPEDAERHLRIRPGVPPESLDWSGLREDQQAFFSTFDPDLASRFRR